MPNRIATITAQLEPISLGELNQQAALQRRADNKYFLPWAGFVEFVASLRRTHVVLEIDERRLFTYDTQYFDTPDLTAYWSHVQGRRKRFKCRSRRYVDSGLCLFELKLKSGRGQTVKHKLPYGEADWGQVTPAAAVFLQECLYTAYGLEFTQPLVPTLRTYYQRVTLMARTSMERITCDFNLAFAVGSRWEGRMERDYVLVETKSERGRGETDQLLWRMGVRPAVGSKYCLGLSLVRPELRSNRFQQARKRFFVRDAEPQADHLPSSPVATAQARAVGEAHAPLLAPLPGGLPH